LLFGAFLAFVFPVLNTRTVSMYDTQDRQISHSCIFKKVF